MQHHVILYPVVYHMIFLHKKTIKDLNSQNSLKTQCDTYVLQAYKNVIAFSSE